jgi:hypothetical protein
MFIKLKDLQETRIDLSKVLTIQPNYSQVCFMMEGNRTLIVDYGADLDNKLYDLKRIDGALGILPNYNPDEDADIELFKKHRARIEGDAVSLEISPNHWVFLGATMVEKFKVWRNYESPI